MNESQNKSYKISPWTAEFRDPVIERDYCRTVERDNARFLRVALVIWGTLLMVFVPLEWIALGNSTAFYVLFAIRLLNVTALLTLAFLLRARPHWVSWGWPVTIVTILGYLLFFAYMRYIPDSGPLGLAVLMLLLFSLYVFVPNRIPLNNLIAVVGISTVMASSIMAGLDAVGLLYMAILLIWPVGVGYFTALRISTGNRRAYHLLQQAEQSNSELQREIRRRQQLEKELKWQAQTDPLTGLFNRRQYELLFNQEMASARRNKTPLTLGLIDLDHFKAINDKYGHDLGDHVLCQVADILQQPLRDSDIIGRFGGEEFIIILPRTDVDQARVVAERMRLALSETIISHQGQTVVVSATFALAELTPEDKDINSVIRRADDALYEGKDSGRNCVVCVRAA
ncbi:GGDEF domain-containing protein [Pseudohongiella sp. SYSU M77423]|uniref:GGDEF domain-containing protein n=1 Tax=Pseudohongiella sp. SYSU M77423 TaxID=3042312 RepID=UPI002480D59E|nr:GGDEF domain-containing protein [Pseudohongiella sp. SYSU M77423]MDH7944340.1 GGDEF domain-containing protein [Pseudohongiella sp. SYSU M77423]